MLEKASVLNGVSFVLAFMASTLAGEDEPCLLQHSDRLGRAHPWKLISLTFVSSAEFIWQNIFPKSNYSFAIEFPRTDLKLGDDFIAP